MENGIAVGLRFRDLLDVDDVLDFIFFFFGFGGVPSLGVVDSEDGR